jgi:hypothetical protein
MGHYLADALYYVLEMQMKHLDYAWFFIVRSGAGPERVVWEYKQKKQG